MFWDDYAPYVIRTFDALCGLVAVVAGGVFVATLADNALALDWGWDLSNLWFAPLLMIGAGVVRKVGGVIFRFIEAIAND